MGRLDDALFRAAYAYSPQSTVGELLQDAIQEIEDKIPEVEILLNVHDEVIFQYKPIHQDSILPRIRRAMERPLIINNRKLVIPCDLKIGDSWGSLKEVKF
jgi:DNA polymerase I-like protein with 3'-5' exonuclease and polymerase domains